MGRVKRGIISRLQRVLVVPAVLRLLLALLRRRHVEIWIGDSHAMSSNRSIVTGSFLAGADGTLVIRVGARLMWSLGRHGFPPWVHWLIRSIARWSRPGQFTPVFMAGEIDVRVHLAPRADQPMDFVAPYVDKCLALAAELGATEVYFAVPPPPCDGVGFDLWYPVVGTIEERLRVFDSLRSRLGAEVADRPHAHLLDLTDTLARPDGSLRPELSDDGAHTNMRAVPLIRTAVRAQLDSGSLTREA